MSLIFGSAIYALQIRFFIRYLVHLIHENKLQGISDNEAIHQATLACIDQGILKHFLKQYGKEVVNMFSLQWNEEEARKYREEYAEEVGPQRGLQRGLQEGLQKGRSEGKGEIILNMLKEHMHLDAIERYSGWSAEQIRALAKKSGLVVE